MDLDTKGELQRIAEALSTLEQLLSCAFILNEPIKGAEVIVSIITEKLENLIK